MGIKYMSICSAEEQCRMYGSDSR